MSELDQCPSVLIFVGKFQRFISGCTHRHGASGRVA